MVAGSNSTSVKDGDESAEGRGEPMPTLRAIRAALAVFVAGYASRRSNGIGICGANSVDVQPELDSSFRRLRALPIS